MSTEPLPSIFAPTPPPDQEVSAGDAPKVAKPPNGRKKRGPRRAPVPPKRKSAPKAAKAARGRPRKARVAATPVSAAEVSSASDLARMLQATTGLKPDDYAAFIRIVDSLAAESKGTRARLVAALGRFFA